MPWRGPRYDGEFPSLGPQIADWAEEYLTVPDGPKAGEPLRLTDEQFAILVRFYGLDDRGGWLFRRASVRRAKGWGKSPLLAVVALAELVGPSRFGGWDADGEPIGIRPASPWVQIAAVSEDQTDNTYSALYAMVSDSDLAKTNGGPVDVGLTRLHLVDDVAGRLEPVTASAGSREGQRITFAVLDETHLWTRRNGGQRLAAVLRRNARKMGARTFESTNAPVIGEDSVAERTHKAAETGAAGLLYDAVEAPWVEDLTDKRAVKKALKVAYGDAAKPKGWIDLDQIVLEIADPASDDHDVRRFWFNQLTSGGDCPFDMKIWDELVDVDRPVPDGASVGLGFDGSISEDRTVLYGCTADAPHIFEIGSWQRPANVTEWRVPRLEVTEAVREAFARWNCVLLGDPPRWWSELEAWTEEFGDDRVIALDTNQARRFAPECDRFATEIRERAFTHDGSSRLRESLAACARKKVRLADDDDDGRSRFVIVKADTRKIDDAVGAVLARAAAALVPDVGPEREVFAAWA